LTPLALDTETALIKIGLLAPPLTCVSWADGEHVGLEWVGDTGPCYRLVRESLETDTLFIGLNIAYDFGVIGAEWPNLLPLIFAAYESDRVTDVGLRQKLIDIAKGQFRGYTDGMTEVYTSHEYSLAKLVERHFKMQMDKSTHRLGFGELRNVHPNQWPAGAAEYAMGDAQMTMKLWQLQESTDAGLLQDQFRQARAAWGLHLISCWGIKTSAPNIERFKIKTVADHAAALKVCKEKGLVRPGGTRDTKKARTLMVQVMEQLGEPTKKTEAFIDLRRKRDKHELLTPKDEKNLEDPLFGISVDEEACEASLDPTLVAYSKVTSLTTVVDTHIPALENGIKYPIQPRFDSLVETGRTSCKGHDGRQPTNGYQLQNVRRLPGIRECFEARPGTVYVEADFSGLELHTWAQTCLWAVGESRMAAALNAKIDPHLVIASTMLGTSYDEAKARYKAGDEEVAGPDGTRQFGKIGNFGFQGGMGEKTFRAWARVQYKTNFSEEQTHFIKESWKQTWPEQEAYFKWIQVQCEQGGGYATIEQWLSKRVRGLVSFTVAANGYFQALGADAAKAALFAVQRECYVDESSPLFGSRAVNFVHDSVCLEVEDDLHKYNAAAKRLVEVMIEEGTKWLPDVPPRAEVTVSRNWSKLAKQVKNAEGLLIPWEYTP